MIDTGLAGRRGQPLTFAYDHGLVDLAARVEAASARLDHLIGEPGGPVVDNGRRQAALWSARLDASPITDETATTIDARLAQGDDVAVTAISAGPGREAGWAQTLKLDALPTQELAGVEYANLRRCMDNLGDLTDMVLERPLETLAALHARVCEGLVDTEMIGRPRRTKQAIHDGAHGRQIYATPSPEDLPALLDDLAVWLGGRSARLPSLVAAGVVHECILEWQPFEAANGRVARAAARLVLRARSIDPRGAAAFERELGRDALGYHEEVAATIRRRGDLTRWLGRWGTAVAASLETAVRQAGWSEAPSPRATDVAGALPREEPVSLADYASRAGVSEERARADVLALERSGLLRRDSRAGGLRWWSVAHPSEGEG